MTGLELARSFRVTSYDVDGYGQLRPSALMGWFQEMGRLHAREIDVTVERLHQLGKTWVVAEMRLEMDARAAVDAELTVTTWPARREDREIVRDFLVTDARGQRVAAASASYVIIDLATRRPVRIGELVPEDYQLDRRALASPSLPLPRLDRVDREVELPVMRRDLDINRHVNNVVYAQWALEPVPEEIWEQHRLAALSIAFRAEVRPGEVVKVAIAVEAGPERTEVRHRVTNAATGAEVARIGTAWVRPATDARRS